MAIDWSKYGEPIDTLEVKQTRDWGEYGIPLDTGETQMGKKPTAVGGMIRDLAETPTELLQNVRAIGQTIRGDSYEDIMKGRYSPYLQKQIIPNSVAEKGSFGKAIGQGLELSSYLPVTSGLGGAVKTSLAGKIGQGALNFAKEGAVGGGLYSTGKAIQEQKSIGDTIMEGLIGTATGAVGGAVLGGVGAIPANLARTFSKAGQLEKYNNALTEFFTGTKRGVKIIADQEKKGKNVADFLTKYRNNFGIPQVENGKFNPSSVVENIYNTANRIETEKFTPLLKSTGEYTDLVDLLSKVQKNINADKQITRGGITQKSLARASDVLNDYITTFGRRVPIDLANEIKRANWAKRFPKAIGEADTIEAEVANIIGRTIKEEIENVTAKYFPNQATNPIKEINGILGDHYSAAKILNEFQGNVVGGGMFSKWLMRLTGAVAGSQGGPIGSLIGSVTADQLANMLQSMKFTNPLRDQILKTFRAEAPQVLKDAEALMRANINKRALPSPSGKPLGRLGQMDLKRASGDVIPAFSKEGGQIDYIGAGRKVIVPKERVLPQASKIIKDKEGLLEKVIDSGATPTKAMAMVAGIEQDEDGNITFNEEKAGLALALVFGGAKFLETNAGKKLMQEIKDYVVDFIENPKLGLSIEDISKKAYKGEKDLTTKILKDLEGKTTVSKQYILDATNRGDLKQVERDLIRDMLKGEKDVVNVPDFAKKVKAELLPLKVKTNPNGTRYENISLQPDLRGNVKNYSENIYESPIKTSAGQIHFSDYSYDKPSAPNYFGHTRIEDMADNKTRRVIEVQSDLYQKGNLEKEISTRNSTAIREIQSLPKNNFDDFEKKAIEIIHKNNADPDIVNYEKLFSGKTSKSLAASSKLQQYNDPTAHFRMIREEIKKASQDGKTKLQFPTGETAMKIEGLGQQNNRWFHVVEGRQRGLLSQESMTVGDEIRDTANSDWVITDVLGDGKFKAIPKERLETRAFQINKGVIDENFVRGFSDSDMNETFDISGKVDTNNPIYKFYEKDVQKYLNKFGGKKVLDENGVSWIEVPVKKEWGDMPVEAFAFLPFLGFGKKKEFDTTGLITVTDNNEVEQEQTPKVIIEKSRNVPIDDNDQKELRAVLFGEISNRTTDKKELEARVILNTILNRYREYRKRGQERPISEIVAMENQYQAYNDNQYFAYINDELDTLGQKKKAEIDAILDKLISEIKNGTFKDNTKGALYYQHLKDGRIEFDSKRPLFKD